MNFPRCEGQLLCYLRVSRRVKGEAGMFPEAVLLPCSLSVHLHVRASSKWALSECDAGQAHTVLSTGPPSMYAARRCTHGVVGGIFPVLSVTAVSCFLSVP